VFIARMVNMLLRVTDLVEAEGRVARAAVTELLVAAVVLALAGALAVLTAVALAGALALALSMVMPTSLALFIVAGVFGLLAWLTALVGRKLASPYR